MKLLLIIFALLCEFVPFTSSAYYYREAPRLNPHPKYFMHLSGYIDPRLKNKIKLSFVQIYSTTRDECYHVNNILAGSEEAPNKIDLYNAVPNKHGFYKVIIPIDRYTSGFCHWQPLSLGLRLTRVKTNFSMPDDLVEYRHKTNQYNASIINLYCKDKLMNCSMKVPKESHGFGSLLRLNMNTSARLTLNLLYKEKENT